ncbi:DUF2797 domain-containing protein [Streptomyces antimicrobicus]|uniref:DUF2797 domain-containing protein n=1 Tax=Streptomyces antimicrobicus TaxID=2883108 RepID=A0ABS8B951_9ACTN|nr:DUF2797 domain-containing protein [Streptomyces antimicrobicus]MCB5181146.1 DUF2797 domain-containing protein [Streptomyces antimicrobicus]
MGWRCAGLRWGGGRPAVGWYGEGRGERSSALVYGQWLAFAGVGARGCLGVRRSGRWTPCPTGAEVPGRAGGGQCAECARLDRSFSVAADTHVADPRPYRVYLAWFGPGLVKVGITAEERGPARLLEQGAVTWSWLGRGPLMAARRTEELLRAALGVPDRIAYGRKRAVRGSLPPAAERAAEVAELHARAGGLAGWPESLERLPCEAVDHAGAFGLDGLPRPRRVLAELADGAVVAGRLAGAAGPDLHLQDGLVVDTRLLAGWELVAVASPEQAVTTAPVREIRPEGDGGQDGLF